MEFPEQLASTLLRRIWRRTSAACSHLHLQCIRIAALQQPTTAWCLYPLPQASLLFHPCCLRRTWGQQPATLCSHCDTQTLFPGPGEPTPSGAAHCCGQAARGLAGGGAGANNAPRSFLQLPGPFIPHPHPAPHGISGTSVRGADCTQLQLQLQLSGIQAASGTADTATQACLSG